MGVKKMINEMGFENSFANHVRPAKAKPTLANGSRDRIQPIGTPTEI
jgi:hypothetical protein